jgi:DNA modification methylase
MFPENLVERVLKLFSFKNDVVLDPFNGSGTTTVVVKKTGRKYLGIDISQEYCDTAEKRIIALNAEKEKD